MEHQSYFACDGEYRCSHWKYKTRSSLKEICIDCSHGSENWDLWHLSGAGRFEHKNTRAVTLDGNKLKKLQFDRWFYQLRVVWGVFGMFVPAMGSYFNFKHFYCLPKYELIGYFFTYSVLVLASYVLDLCTCLSLSLDFYWNWKSYTIQMFFR